MWFMRHKRSNGDAVAVKKIMRTEMNAAIIARDVGISRYIGEHVGKLVQRNHAWLMYARNGSVLSLT